MNIGKLFKYVYLLILVGCIAAYMIYGSDAVLEQVKIFSGQLDQWYDAHPFIAIGGFFLLFTFINAALVPGSLPLMLLAGAMFGWPLGLSLCVAAGTLGSLMAFLGIRYWFAAPLRQRYQKVISVTDKQIEKNGMLYLLILRVSPGIPTNVISVAMALTKVSLPQFFVATIFGIVPWYAVYVAAGEKLMQLESFGEIVTPEMIAGSVAMVILLAGVLWLKEKFGISNKLYKQV